MIQQVIVNERSVGPVVPRQASCPQQRHHRLSGAGAADNQVLSLQWQRQGFILILVQILNPWQRESAGAVYWHR
jgi:hypothetical protein